MTFAELGITGIDETSSIIQRVPCPQPACKEKKNRNNLAVNVKEGWWKCHRCGWSGNIETYGKFDKIRQAAKRPRTQPRTFSKQTKDYLLSRGITQGTVINYGCWEIIQGTKHILAIPIYIGHTMVNVKYVRINPRENENKCWSLKKDIGALPSYMGINNVDLDNSDYVIISEGQWDMFTWAQAEYKNSISVPDGAPGGDPENWLSKFNFLKHKTTQATMNKARIIYLACDDDENGENLKRYLATYYGKARCRVISYPSGYKDINDVLKGNEKKGLKPLGIKGVRECFENSYPYPIKGIIRPSHVIHEINQISEKGYERGIMTGIPELDKLFSFKKKMLTVITGIPKSGKALSIDTDIPTPDGFKKIKDIEVGDVVFDENGKQCNVINSTGIMYGRECYKIIFDDGSNVVADAEHQWLTETRSARLSEIRARKNKRDKPRELLPRGTDQTHKRTFPGIMTTSQIYDTVYVKEKNSKRINHAIYLSKAVEYSNNKKHPINPYLLGVWLGYGHSYGGGITTQDKEVIETIRSLGYRVNKHTAKYAYGIIGLRGLLHRLNLLQNKHIPDEYLYSTYQNRLLLLRGLVDSDGYIGKNGEEIEYCTVRKQLAEDVVQLIESLGIKALMKINDAKLYGVKKGLRYRIYFRPHIQVCHIKRRKEKLKLYSGVRNKKRYIHQCIRVDSVPVKCIQVDSPSSLFLCTRHFIPTHNSVFTRWLLTKLISHNPKLNLQFGMYSPEQRPPSREIAKLAEVVTGKSIYRGNYHYMGDEAKDRALRFMGNHFHIIAPDRKNFETFGNQVKPGEINYMDNVLKYVRYLKQTRNIFGFVIDAWNKLEHNFNQYKTSETNYISRELDKLLEFCDYNDVHCWMIAHPTKMKRADAKNYEMPNLYDISGSKSWKEKTDLGIIIHRQPWEAGEGDNWIYNKKAPTIVCTENIRFDEIGEVGQVDMEFDIMNGRFRIAGKKEAEQTQMQPINPQKEEISEEEEEIFPFPQNGDDLPF